MEGGTSLVPTALEQKPLIDILNERGISTIELARMAGIHPNVTSRAVRSGSIKIHNTCALAIAQALGLEVSDIYWVNGRSDTGRPCHTGVAITSIDATSRDTLCPVHNTVLPATKICDDCAY